MYSLPPIEYDEFVLLLGTLKWAARELSHSTESRAAAIMALAEMLENEAIVTDDD